MEEDNLQAKQMPIFKLGCGKYCVYKTPHFVGGGQNIHFKQGLFVNKVWKQ